MFGRLFLKYDEAKCMYAEGTESANITEDWGQHTAEIDDEQVDDELDDLHHCEVLFPLGSPSELKRDDMCIEDVPIFWRHRRSRNNNSLRTRRFN